MTTRPIHLSQLNELLRWQQFTCDLAVLCQTVDRSTDSDEIVHETVAKTVAPATRFFKRIDFSPKFFFYATVLFCDGSHFSVRNTSAFPI